MNSSKIIIEVKQSSMYKLQTRYYSGARSSNKPSCVRRWTDWKLVKGCRCWTIASYPSLVIWLAVGVLRNGLVNDSSAHLCFQLYSHGPIISLGKLLKGWKRLLLSTNVRFGETQDMGYLDLTRILLDGYLRSAWLYELSTNQHYERARCSDLDQIQLKAHSSSSLF